MAFTRDIIDWYSVNKRDLPWRNTKNPYFIWLSEIILQQTQVIQGLSYYQNFVFKYPTIKDLAEAPEGEVLKLWQGLGYYSRARNLHKAAKLLISEYHGVFPDSYEHIRKLPGVGDYTAAAIASFAFDLVYPVLDGNVSRVLTRIYGIWTPIDTGAGKKELMIWLNKLIDKKNPAIFNQAIMEFGALQCKPKQPVCDTCPFQKDCYAFLQQKISELPLKQNKTKVRNRYIYYLIQTENDKIRMHHRTSKDIWQNLYDFPHLDKDQPLSKEDLPKGLKLWTYKHQLSHQTLHIEFWQVEDLDTEQKKGTKFYKPNEIQKLAVPKPVSEFFHKEYKF